LEQQGRAAREPEIPLTNTDDSQHMRMRSAPLTEWLREKSIRNIPVGHRYVITPVTVINSVRVVRQLSLMMTHMLLDLLTLFTKHCLMMKKHSSRFVEIDK
jgi:hypothetical protein